MRSEKRREKPAVVFAVCLIVIAATVLIMMGIRAKYITSVPLSGTVTFEANLADAVTLTEHQATRNVDGSYRLGTETTYDNSYVVMPGVDIPKDPSFTITNKSSIDVYLYVEIVDTSPGTVTYELESGWTKLEITGRNVYEYTDTISQGGSQNIPILKDDVIHVSDKYNPALSGFELKFYGYMVQQEDGKTSTDIFKDNYPTAPTT